MPTRQQLESALSNADKAGDLHEAKALANALKGGQFDQPEMPEGHISDVVTEPIKAITSNLVGTIVGGLAGAATAMVSGAEEGTEVIQGVQQAASDFGKPTTQRGQAALITIGDLMEKGLDLARFPVSGLAGLAALISGQGIDEAAKTVESVQEKGIGKTAGEKTYQATGDPLLSTVVEVSPEIIGSIFPLTRIAATRSALKEKIADEIRSGSGSSDLVKYMIDGANKLKTDRVAQEAVKQGFGASVVMAIKGSSKLDKTKMAEMTRIKEKGNKNALFAIDNRPSDIAGNSLVERVNFVKDVNLKAGRQVDKAAKNLQGKSVDSAEPISKFMDNLDELGVRLNKQLKPNFKDSDIEFSAGPKAAIANIIEVLSRGKPGTPPDAFRLHKVKRFIDEVVTYGKQGEGIKGKTEKILKQLRLDLDAALDNKFPEYDAVNTAYADTVSALSALQDVAGRKLDLFGVNADKATGTLLRRMMSNAQSRVNLPDAVFDLESAAKKYGGKFEDNIKMQMLFADELDNVSGPVARTSLAGEVGKEVKRGADIVLGQKTAAGIAAETVAAAADKLRGINEANAFKSINELLKR